jgi:hypothetical protein
VGEGATQRWPEARTSCWRHLRLDIPLTVLAGYTHRLHVIEPFQDEAKREFGWDQDEGRL